MDRKMNASRILHPLVLRSLFLRSLGLLCLGLVSLWGGPLGAQESAPGTFAEIIEVRVVNVEVVVTDEDGNRVAGLDRDQFQLEVDGEAQSIDFFNEVVGGEALSEEEGEEGAEAVEDPALEGLPGFSPGEPVSTSYLVFVDDFFSIKRDRNEVLEALADDLPLLTPGDRMAIVAFDGRRLDMISSWSDSQKELQRALRKAGDRKAYGLQRLAERRNFRSIRLDFNSLEPESTVDGTRLDIEEEQFAVQISEQVERVVAAATATLRSFAQPPGRKVMLMVAGGWPFDPVRFTVTDPNRVILDRGVPSGPELFEPLTETANRLGYTLYPVDVPTSSLDLADRDLASLRNIPSGAALEPDFVREQELHASLGFVAESTGGKALINSASLDALPRAVEDTRTFYWLGFTPEWRGDDEVHEIRVRVAGADGQRLEVRTRESYQDLSRNAEVAMMVESGLLFGNAPSSEKLTVVLGEPKRERFRKMRVPLGIRFQAQDIAFVPTNEGGFGAQVLLVISVMDESGARAPVYRLPLAFAQQEEPDGERWVGYDTELELRRADHDVVVAIYDQFGGSLLSSAVSVKP
ncbi:MAG: VWA domain-containing protein [Acidobacteriota bacterium]